MNWLRLFVKKEEDSDYTELTVYGEQSFVVSKKLLDPNSIDVVNCESSKTILLPSEVSVNKTFFDEWQTSGTTFNAFSFYDAKITNADSDVLIQGSLYFKKYNRETNNYEVLVSSKVGNLSQRLSGKTLDKLATVSNYAHLFNWANVKSSWSTNTGWQARIKYAPIDNGLGLGTYVDGVFNDELVNASKGADMFRTFAPHINVKQAVADIFLSEGIDYEDKSEVGDFFMCIGGVEKAIPNINTVCSNVNDQMIYFPAGYVNIGLEYTNVSAGFVIGSNADYLIFTKDGDFVGTLNLQGKGINGTNIYYDVFLNDVSVDSGLFVTVSNGGFVKSVNFDSLSVSENDVMTIYLYVTSSTSITVTSNSLTGTIRRNTLGYLKGVNQIDLLKAYINHFNLLPLYNYSTNKITIWSYNRLITDNASIKDWSAKIDYSKEFSEVSLTEVLSNQFEYKLRETKNYIDREVRTKELFPYGSLKLSLPTQSTKGKEEINTIFAPFINSHIHAALFTIMANYEDVNKPQQNDYPYTIAFFNGQGALGTYYIKNETGAIQSYGQWPNFDMSQSGKGLYISRPDVYNGNIDSSTCTTVFNDFHAKKFSEWVGLVWNDNGNVTINESALVNAKIIECSMWLSDSDFRAINFGEQIKITNQFGTDEYYRLLEVSDFDILSRKPAKVKLIKKVL